MAQYQIEVSHTEQGCVSALDTIVTYGMHLLQQAWLGCAVGVHTCWLNLEADSESEARGVLPPSLRNQARVVEVKKFTPEEIKSLHV